jgi:hypothetical protein
MQLWGRTCGVVAASHALLALRQPSHESNLGDNVENTKQILLPIFSDVQLRVGDTAEQ